MVRPSLRSRAQARLKRRLPGSRTTVHYVRRRPSASVCPVTGQKLNGVPRLRPAQLGKLPKTARRPSRPYGGRVSHTALSNAIRAKVLEEYKPE